jgi:hypothetical protein
VLVRGSANWLYCAGGENKARKGKESDFMMQESGELVGERMVK